MTYNPNETLYCVTVTLINGVLETYGPKAVGIAYQRQGDHGEFIKIPTCPVTDTAYSMLLEQYGEVTNINTIRGFTKRIHFHQNDAKSSAAKMDREIKQFLGNEIARVRELLDNLTVTQRNMNKGGS